MNTMVKLPTSNYSIWKSMMGDVLYCKELHDSIEGDSKEVNIILGKYSVLAIKPVSILLQNIPKKYQVVSASIGPYQPVLAFWLIQ